MGLMLMTFGCQKDDGLMPTEHESNFSRPAFSVSRINSKDISKNKVLTDKISNLKERLEKRKKEDGTFSKTIDVSQYGFFIDTDKGIEIISQDSTSHTFTFPAIRTVATDVVENLLLSLQEDGTYKAMLITYNLNDQERQDLRNEINVDLADKITIDNLEDDAFVDAIFSRDLYPGDCVGIMRCPFKGWHVAGNSCIAEGRGDLVLDTSMCGGGSQGGGITGMPGGNNPNPWNGDQTSQGGGGTFNQNPTLPVIPVKTSLQKILECVPSLFEVPNATSWLQDLRHKRQAGQMWQYLNDNGCSEGAQEFIEEILNSNPDDNDIIDYELEMFVEITETVAFQEQTCLKAIKDDVVATDEINKIVKKFEPTYPVLHLEWGMFSNPDWGNTGNTGLNANQDTAFINLNSESLSHVSNIVMVKTIAHEIIHAELYRKLKELVDDYHIISLEEYNALQDNFMGIADYTLRYSNREYSQNIMGDITSWGLYPDLSLAHHNQMAAFYRATLIDVMKAYDLSKGTTRLNAEEFYEAIS